MLRYHSLTVAFLGFSALATLALCAEDAPQLQIINGSKEIIDVFWQESDSQRVPQGSIAPGKDRLISTMLGHRFVIVGREDKKEVSVTS